MTKLDILRLDSTTENDTAATLNINTNFENIQKAIENTLSRDGTAPNYMDADLDMNSYRIINVGTAVDDTDAVSYKQFKEEIGEATVAASSAAASAAQAATSAQSALVSSTNAINSVRNAENVLSYAQNLLSETQDYVNAARDDIAETASTNIESINKTVADAKQEINTAIEEGTADVNSAIDDATMRLSETIEESVEEVKTAALEAAQSAINNAAAEATAIVIEYTNNELKPELATYRDSADEDARAAEDWAKTSKIWATGEDNEVQAIEANEHSSRGYADLAMAIANTPEDVPVDTSTLLALEIIKGPKGDSGDAEFSGDVSFEGSFNVHGDDNHPVKVTSMAGTSASGYQVVDSNGLGDSDFEHYATGDRYGTRITNHNSTSNTSVSVDLYQSNVGKSVLDTTTVDNVLVPTVATSDNSNKVASTAFVRNVLSTIYPVGSIYIATAATCPMQELGVGIWKIVGTSLVSGAEATVVGNGMALGLTNGTNNLGVNMSGGNNNWLIANTNVYGKNVGDSVSNTWATPPQSAIGVTTDPAKSGVVASLPTITANIFRRIS